MEQVTLDEIYKEMRRMRNEIKELRSVFIEEEEVSEDERKEMNTLFKEIEEGKGKPWKPGKR